MDTSKLVGLLAVIAAPVVAVYAVAGQAAWCVLLPIIAVLLVLAVRAGRDYERVRKQALREAEAARQQWGEQ